MKKKAITLGLTSLLLCSLLISNVTAEEDVPQQLTIDVPAEASEGAQFLVTVTVPAGDSDIPQESGNATVIFLDNTYETDNNGEIYLTAPDVDSDIPFSITARKTGFTDATTTITIRDKNSHPPPEPQLIISISSTVIEGEDFDVLVATVDTTVSYVLVVFNEEEFITNAVGRVTITAPLIDSDTRYSITASKTRYLSATESIQVLDQPDNQGNDVPRPQQAWIYGRITDSSQNITEGARICALLSDKELCVLSDTQGRYNITTAPGIYMIKVTKENYVTNIMYDVEVQNNNAIQINVILEKKEEQTTPTTPYSTADIAINWGIENGQIGATITTTTGQLTESKIYDDKIHIQLVPSEKGKFTFNVSGPDGENGTIIAIHLNDAKTLLDMNIVDLAAINVVYDGVTIPMATTFDDVFNLTSSESEPSWVAVVANNGVTIVIHVPHFSEHSITIQSIAEVVKTFGGITAIIVYVVVIMIFALITAIPIVRLLKKTK